MSTSIVSPQRTHVQSPAYALLLAAVELRTWARGASPRERAELMRQARATCPSGTLGVIRTALAPRMSLDDLLAEAAKLVVKPRWRHGMRGFVDEVFRGEHTNGNGRY